jgi:hypothetical protein
LFSKIYLLLNIQYPLARRKIGPNFIKSKALLLKESPIAGGYLTTQATTIFSAIHELNRLTAARGNKIGIAKPYIKVI